MIRRQKKLRDLVTAWNESRVEGAPILVFLHGYPDTPETWNAQCEFFGARYNLVVPYIRGAGFSEGGSSKHRYGRTATTMDVLQILKSIDPERRLPVYLVGHDLGAVHAAHTAPFLGQRLKGLVLINGLPLETMRGRIQSPRQILKSWYIYLMLIPFLPEAIIRRFPKPLVRFAFRLGGLNDLHDTSAEGALYPMNQYRQFFREMIFSKKMVRIKAPTLVLWGSDDAFLETPTRNEFNALSKNVTIRILEANHWLHRQRSEDVNRLMEVFFKAAENVRQSPTMAL